MQLKANLFDRWSVSLLTAAGLFTAPNAFAQNAPYPQQPAPYGQQPYPQAQPYPQQQQQPYPQQQQQPYPQQQAYPQQPPQAYPQGQPYPQQPYPQQQPYGQYTPPAATPPKPAVRGDGEFNFLLGASAVYGIGSGVWIDGLAKASDPGLALIAPVALGAAVPVGVFFWDRAAPFNPGVPASMATGITLGAVEGFAIAATQAQHSATGSEWSFGTASTVTWVFASGGAVGGWAFGEWLQPDPKSMGFIAGGAGWGAIAGSLFGAGVSGRDWKDGASVAGLIGYNVGLLGAGALSTVYTPSWTTQKWMWVGFGAGAAAASIVYPFYLLSPNSDPKHGLVANSLGGLAGLALAGVFTANFSDGDEKKGASAPPFQIGFAPTPGGGGQMTAYGMW